MGQREIDPALTSTLIPSFLNFRSWAVQPQRTEVWSTQEGDHKVQETDKGLVESNLGRGGGAVLKKEQNLYSMQRREAWAEGRGTQPSWPRPPGASSGTCPRGQEMVGYGQRLDQGW